MLRRLAGLRPGGARPSTAVDARWVDSSASTADRLATLWNLHVGPPLEHDGETSLVFPAVREDGSQAVLKLSRPGVAVAREAEALSLVDGSCAVRLLASDIDRGALLLEAADATRRLSDESDREQAIDAAVDILLQWWRPVPPHSSIRTLQEINVDHHRALSGRKRWLARRIPGRDVERALEALTEPPGEAVLLHTDLHLGNVLMGHRGGWLAIDPQPLIGPRVHDLEPLIRDAPVVSPSLARTRLDRLVERAGVDREEAARSILARGLVVGSWSIEEGFADWGWRHIDAVLRTVS
ncbi:MAG TPA: aminoglycoside phosphotransferase family protein [Ilumatobacteraceae bacterium]|nr:aminoglycoside phosphotransferase family protein [Ilumatobacteraceae bacterium]HRB03355.1 aminoglycoside phosphotransferase family protein [Ilumatobacteraceae bacterium]